MLAVALGNVKQLHIGGVPLQVIPEHGSVVLDVPGVPGQAQLLVHGLQGLLALAAHRHPEGGLRPHGGGKGAQGLLVHLLCHAVVHLSIMRVRVMGWPEYWE